MQGLSGRISIVVPAKDEEESIPILAGEIERSFDAAGLDWECIWVDDGSTDSTLEVLRRLSGGNPRHQYISLDRNYGQSAAMAAAFSLVSGEIIGTLDSDLQSDPADLPRMVGMLQRGKVDMVNGIRARRNDSFVRRVSSRVGNGVRNMLTRPPLTDVGCSVRVFYRECLEDVPVWKGMHRFIPSLALMRGHNMVETPVNHRAREYGQPKYGISNRMWVGLWDCFAVRWMQSRLVWGKIGEKSPGIGGTDDDR